MPLDPPYSDLRDNFVIHIGNEPKPISPPNLVRRPKQQNDAATIPSSSVSTCAQNKVSLETKQNVALASVKAKASQATAHAIPTANRFQVLNDELLQTS
ncbi:hypothetical protein YC2023_077531 [Brassica napus]